MESKNRLLVKDDVGKAKPCVVKLPPSDFVFGKPDSKDEAGAAQLTSSWNYGTLNTQGARAPQVVDFKKMNKMKLMNRGLSHKVSRSTRIPG